MRGSTCLIAVLWVAGVSVAAAQNVTIQLPNFSTFGVNTTVLVPDSGRSPLAAERQAFYSRYSSLGFNRRTAYGAQRRAALSSATATIHDPAQADRDVLRRARARRTNWKRGTTRSVLPEQAEAVDPGLQSVAELQRRRADAEATQRSEARELFQKARRARDAGKPAVAAVYYGMAARRVDGPTRQRIEQEARAVENAR
ncbi:MAG: hypothetical protein DWQ37_13260 [Planctomycetota bacterium]|nr:MAG: hypothetical protein DWQ37_13260 [Planctomycetota bacterium]